MMLDRAALDLLDREALVAVVRRRQVLHIPPAPVEVSEHVARRRVCPQCGRAHTPPLALGAAVYGQQRLSTDTLAYSTHEGAHQRCWAHLLRDVHDLRAAHPDDAGVAAWADGLHALYQEARRQAARDRPEGARLAARGALERRLVAPCQPFWAAECAAPQATLCRRIDWFLDELLTLVADPAVPADNNLAERRLRPLVIARKVSGGTRSAEGSRVRMALASLFATWRAQGRDPLAACHQLLLAQTL
jgi:hypothetical protein